MNAAEMFSHWAEVRRDLLRALDLLRDDQLAFVPHEGLWSLGTVARHIAGAEHFWFRTVVGGQPDCEFTAEQYPTVAAVKALLARTHEETLRYLETVQEGDLDRVYTTPWGEAPTLRWIIWHVLEHEIHHRGEIFLMLGLQGMRGPDI